MKHGSYVGEQILCLSNHGKMSYEKLAICISKTQNGGFLRGFLGECLRSVWEGVLGDIRGYLGV